MGRAGNRLPILLLLLSISARFESYLKLQKELEYLALKKEPRAGLYEKIETDFEVDDRMKNRH